MNIHSKDPLQSIKDTFGHLSQLYFGQFPSLKEQKIITQLGQRLCEPYSDIHEHLLRDIHRLSGVQVPYQRVGTFWKYLGYQNENPASDIRGGGLLSLDNLIYFLSTHPKMAQKMLHRQSRDNLTAENTMESYPWAAVGINITRYIATEFEIIETSGRLKKSNFSPKTTWGYLAQVDGFNRLYCVAFILLNYIWHDMKATYMQFPQVLSRMKAEFTSFLLFTSSLSELEMTVYQHVNYSFDPSFGVDYTILPHSSEENENVDYDLLQFDDIEKGITPSPPQASTSFIMPDYITSDLFSPSSDLNYDISSSGLRKRKNHHLVSVV